MATRFCGKLFGFVNRDLSGAQPRNDALAEKGMRGKGGSLVPASVTKGPERDNRSGCHSSWSLGNLRVGCGV